MKILSSKFLLWSAACVFIGFVMLGTSSCSKKYGCPAVEQTDISKPQKSTSGLFGDDFGKAKKKKKKKN